MQQQQAWAPGITKITWTDNLGDSPGRTDKHSGEMFLNTRLLTGMPKSKVRFIMLHEEGHIKNQSRDELKADAWACAEYIKQGYNPWDAVELLRQLLNPNNPEHRQRIDNQILRARQYDSQAKQIIKI